MDDYNGYNFSSMIEDERKLLKNFGKKLKSYRLKKGFTQERLGDMAKVNYKYIGEIERGEKNPTLIILCKLSQSLGIKVSDIVSML